MSKYIIDLRPDCKVVQQICASNENVNVGARSVGLLDALTDDYIKENFKYLLDAEYQRGFEDGKAVNGKGCKGCKYERQGVTLPPCNQCCNIYANHWTAKQTDDKIEVGDEVEWKNIENNGGKGIVLWIADNSVNGRKLCDIMSASGSAGTWHTDEVVKTGRHFDIASILEDMHHD